MKVFLSSTRVDLVDHRNKAVEAIARLDQQPGRMEIFGARPAEAQKASLEEVDDCELFVGVYAHRYGYIPQGAAISITEAEFRRAQDLDKPIFCFLVQEDYPWSPLMVEDEPGRSKLRLLKSEIERTLVIERFTTPDDLASKVGTSLGRYLLSFGPLVNELKNVIESHSTVAHADKEAVNDALAAVAEIANRTIQYGAARRSSPTDREEEAQLARGWSDAGMKLRQLPNPPPGELIDRYFLKSEYWADPKRWTDERVEQARIDLTELTAESRRLLLGMQLPEN